MPQESSFNSYTQPPRGLLFVGDKPDGADFVGPFEIRTDSGASLDTIFFIPKIDGMRVTPDGFKVVVRDAKGTVAVRELTMEEKKQFSMITNIGK